jgi:hypothetical protein
MHSMLHRYSMSMYLLFYINTLLLYAIIFQLLAHLTCVTMRTLHTTIYNAYIICGSFYFGDLPKPYSVFLKSESNTISINSVAFTCFKDFHIQSIGERTNLVCGVCLIALIFFKGRGCILNNLIKLY